MKTFTSLCEKSQPKLKEFVSKQLAKTHQTVISTDGFVYAQGTMPVLLVAHLDTVHHALPEVIWYDKTNDSLSSPQGIGGDDRCGVYIIFEILKRHNCSVLFCEDEELGCIGANKFTKTGLAGQLAGTFNYIIEFDRKGSNDAVFYDCDNWDFEDFITKEFYKTACGSFSDISVIAPCLGCAAVNLSCGYYNPHTTKEYVVWSEMQKTIEEACKILARTTAEDTFEYIEVARYNDRFCDDWTWYEEKYADNDKDFYRITYEDEYGRHQEYNTTALSMEEAVGKFCIDTLLSYADIIEIALS